RGEIVLADVHAVGACEPRDVGAVVDDDGRTVMARVRDNGGGGVEHRPARHRLGAQLQESGAAGQERTREADRWPAGARRGMDVDEGVQNGDWGLGVGDWGEWWSGITHHQSPQSPDTNPDHPNPQSAIPNPLSITLPRRGDRWRCS